MFGYWKDKYYTLYREASLAEQLFTTALHTLESHIHYLERKLRECNQVVVADRLSLVIQFGTVTIKSTHMSVTAPVGKFAIVTIKGLDASQVEGPITEIELSSTDTSVLLVEPVFDTDGTTPIANQRKVTTLKEGPATLSASAKNSNGQLISGTEDWTVQAGAPPVIVAQSLVFAYSPLQDVPATT